MGIPDSRRLSSHDYPADLSARAGMSGLEVDGGFKCLIRRLHDVWVPWYRTFGSSYANQAVTPSAGVRTEADGRDGCPMNNAPTMVQSGSAPRVSASCG